MPLCGSDSGCSCALVSAPALTGLIGTELPTISVSGTGLSGDPWRIALNPDWAAQIADRVQAVPWTNATLAGAWVNVGGGAGAPADASYRLVGDMVQIRGAVRNGVAGTTIFTLPVGYRPPTKMEFLNNAFNVNGAFSVNTDGTVKNIRPGTPTSFELNCSFSITA